MGSSTVYTKQRQMFTFKVNTCNTCNLTPSKVKIEHSIKNCFFPTPVFLPQKKQFPGAFLRQESMLAVRPFVANYNVMHCLRDGQAGLFLFRSFQKVTLIEKMSCRIHHVTGIIMETFHVFNITLSAGGISFYQLAEALTVTCRNQTVHFRNFTLLTAVRLQPVGGTLAAN